MPVSHTVLQPLSVSLMQPGSASQENVDRIDPYYDLPPDPVTQIPAYIRRWLDGRRQRRRAAEDAEAGASDSPMKGIPADTPTQVTVIIAMPSQDSRSHFHTHSYTNHPLETFTSSEPESSTQGASTSYQVEPVIHEEKEGGVPFEYCLGTTVVPLVGGPSASQVSLRAARSRSVNLHRTRS